MSRRSANDSGITGWSVPNPGQPNEVSSTKSAVASASLDHGVRRGPTKWVWLVILLLVVVAATALILLPSDRITPSTCARINNGMTEDEVVSVLGRLPDHQYHPWDKFPFLQPPPEIAPEWEKCWEGQSGDIFIQFDAKGLVCASGFLPK